MVMNSAAMSLIVRAEVQSSRRRRTGTVHRGCRRAESGRGPRDRRRRRPKFAETERRGLRRRRIAVEPDGGRHAA